MLDSLPFNILLIFISSPLPCIRSGSPGQHSVATFSLPLGAGTTVTHVSFDYRYEVGFGAPAPGVGTNFTLVAAGTPVYASPQYDDYPYSKSHPNYSLPVEVSATTSINVPSSGPLSRLEIKFDNNDRNIQLLLPLVVNISCTGGPCAAPAPAPPKRQYCPAPVDELSSEFSSGAQDS